MTSRSKIFKDLGIDKIYHIPDDQTNARWDEEDPGYDTVKEGEKYRKAMSIDLSRIADTDREFNFFGAHSNMFKLDSITFEVIEDPDDGYRSHMDSVVITMDENLNGFFDRPLAKVKLKSENDVIGQDDLEVYGVFDGYSLRDVEDDHIWLLFGTNNTDDYYPGFHFEYMPKKI